MAVHLCVVVMLSFDHAYIYIHTVLNYRTIATKIYLNYNSNIVEYIIISGSRIICEIILL